MQGRQGVDSALACVRWEPTRGGAFVWYGMGDRGTEGAGGNHGERGRREHGEGGGGWRKQVG